MNNTLRAACLVSFGLLAFTGCKRKENASPNYNAAATINGQGFTTPAASATDGPVFALFFNPTGNVSPYPAIRIGITTFTGVPGTFVIDSVSATARIDSSETVSIPAAYGSVTILSVTPTTVSGYFNFTCSDSTRVVNGSFFASRN